MAGGCQSRLSGQEMHELNELRLIDILLAKKTRPYG